MASISKRPNGKWRARYRDEAGKEHSRHFDRKVDGQHWLDTVTASVHAGTYVDPSTSRITVTEMGEKWLDANPSWSASTRARNTSILAGRIGPQWGSIPVSNVTFEAVQSWVAKLSATGLAGGSIRKIVGVLSSIMRLAVRTRRLSSNPVQGVDLPRQALARRRYLSARQVEALVKASGPNADVVLTLAYCGLRFGELAALRMRHVDMVRRRFRIEESVTEVNGRLEWSSPKDHQRRSVPFPVFLAEPLNARVATLTDDDLVFATERGGALRIRNMRRDWFDHAADEAGVAGLTPHELRHTAASMAVSAGASVLALQRMLGHEKPSVTLDVYSDLFDEDLDAVADALAGVRSQILADSLRTAAV